MSRALTRNWPVEATPETLNPNLAVGERNITAHLQGQLQHHYLADRQLSMKRAWEG